MSICSGGSTSTSRRLLEERGLEATGGCGDGIVTPDYEMFITEPNTAEECVAAASAGEETPEGCEPIVKTLDEVVATTYAYLGELTDAQKAKFGLLGEECDVPPPSLVCNKCREPPGMECGDGIRFELNQTLLEIMQSRIAWLTSPNRTANDTRHMNITNDSLTIPPYPVEFCDDMNIGGGDGCSPTCEIEPGWHCEQGPSHVAVGDTCTQICGDGYVVNPEYLKKGVEGEYCDDGNTRSGDGCSATCGKETFWKCFNDVMVPEFPGRLFRSRCVDTTPPKMISAAFDETYSRIFLVFDRPVADLTSQVAGNPFFQLRGACSQRRTRVRAHLCLEQPDSGNCKPWQPLVSRLMRE
jgi:cysteine-rich repeat protein